LSRHEGAKRMRALSSESDDTAELDLASSSPPHGGGSGLSATCALERRKTESKALLPRRQLKKPQRMLTTDNLGEQGVTRDAAPPLSGGVIAEQKEQPDGENAWAKPQRVSPVVPCRFGFRETNSSRSPHSPQERWSHIVSNKENTGEPTRR